MGLIVTSGASNATSLCTVAEATAYIAASGLSTTDWLDMSTAEQENLLVLAGIALNNLQWVGFKSYVNQAMAWPRWMGTEDDFTAATALMPVNVKKAQALMAYDVIYRGIQGRTSPSAGPATDAIKSLSLFGDISLSFRDSTDVPLKDGISLAGLLRAGHAQIYLLLSRWVTEISFTGHWDDIVPDLLDEVIGTVVEATT